MHLCVYWLRYILWSDDFGPYAQMCWSGHPHVIAEGCNYYYQIWHLFVRMSCTNNNTRWDYKFILRLDLWFCAFVSLFDYEFYSRSSICIFIAKCKCRWKIYFFCTCKNLITTKYFCWLLKWSLTKCHQRQQLNSAVHISKINKKILMFPVILFSI